MDWKIPLFKIYWDEEDVRLVTEAIKRGMFWAIGPNIEKLEMMLADYIGTKYAVVLNSGTSALHAALLACGIGRGDEVIVPPLTFIATANAPLFIGAKPVFADIEEQTLGLDPKDVESKITAKTKAIIPVHFAGCPCLIEELKEIAEQHKLILIEDAAESIGAAIDGKKVGTFGDCAIFSFCSNKVITTGEGGAVVTNSVEIYEKLKLIRSHGRAETVNYFSSAELMDYINLGFNFRMSDITAALGVAQLEKVDRIIEMRRKKAGELSVKLSKIAEIETPSPPQNAFHVYQIYNIRLRDGREKRDALAAYLAEKGVLTKVSFPLVHLTHFYKNELGYKCKLPIAESLIERILDLPLYPTLTDEEIDYIVDAIAVFFASGGKA